MFEAPMGPTRVDPLATARLIVQLYMERDACTENGVAEGTHRAVASRAFGRAQDGFPVEASSTEFFSSSDEGVSKPTAHLSTRIQSTLIFVLLCTMVSIVVLSHALSVHY
jgi:hypothetical protein